MLQSPKVLEQSVKLNDCLVEETKAKPEPKCHMCSIEKAQVKCLCSEEPFCLKCSALHMINSPQVSHLLEMLEAPLSNKLREKRKRMLSFEKTLTENELNVEALCKLIQETKTALSDLNTQHIAMVKSTALQIHNEVTKEEQSILGQLQKAYKHKIASLDSLLLEAITSGLIANYNAPGMLDYLPRIFQCQSNKKSSTTYFSTQESKPTARDALAQRFSAIRFTSHHQIS